MVKDEPGYSKNHTSLMHKTIKKVSQDLEAMKFNTAIAAMMSAINDFNASGYITKDELRDFVTLLYPVAPHITEEIWEVRGTILISRDADIETAKEVLRKDEKLMSFMEGKTVAKEIFVNGKIFNIVVK